LWGRGPLATMRNFAYVRILVLGLSSQIVPSVAQTQNHPLKFDKEIGVGWRTGKYGGWMSFVAFSADGTMVASDGPAAADDVSGDLTLWSFPDGRLIKRLPHDQRPFRMIGNTTRRSTASRNWKREGQ